ncbi:MAG: PQQ-binding-like beta-propeller repeat protein [Candidatus Lokiarchaeota archaeon]|nr:PQQ-binding-like beta-propeller repeat protein [Candidatus Lokiarchaeota archaeon]
MVVAENGSLLWNFSTNDDVESSPALGDINGDGKIEGFVVSDDRNLYAIHGKNGSKLWKFWPKAPIKSSPAIADVDFDEALEVVVGTDIYIWDLQ